MIDGNNRSSILGEEWDWVALPLLGNNNLVGRRDNREDSMDHDGSMQDDDHPLFVRGGDQTVEDRSVRNISPACLCRMGRSLEVGMAIALDNNMGLVGHKESPSGTLKEVGDHGDANPIIESCCLLEGEKSADCTPLGEHDLYQVP